MTALQKERFTKFRKAGGIDLPVAASVKIYKGAWCVLEGGYLRPAHASATGTNAGRASDTVDNTNGSAGAVSAHVKFLKEKTFMAMIGNSGEFVQADIGNTAYLLDDQTVTHTSAGHVAMGTAWWLETNNGVQTVFVEV